MTGTCFVFLLTVLVFVTGTQSLLCYWCSGVGSDRECEQHPYAVRTGPIYINCPSRYCITAKVTNALTGEVQSFARLCDNIPRGNQCVRDSRLLTCYESCTTDLCNNGNPGPDYLHTVNYASYHSSLYSTRRGQYLTPTRKTNEENDVADIAAYRGVIENGGKERSRENFVDENVADFSLGNTKKNDATSNERRYDDDGMAEGSFTSDEEKLQDRTLAHRHKSSAPNASSHLRNEKDGQTGTTAHPKTNGESSPVLSTPFVISTTQTTSIDKLYHSARAFDSTGTAASTSSEHQNDTTIDQDGLRQGEGSQQKEEQSQTTKSYKYVDPALGTPRLVMDQHPTAYISLPPENDDQESLPTSLDLEDDNGDRTTFSRPAAPQPSAVTDQNPNDSVSSPSHATSSVSTRKVHHGHLIPVIAGPHYGHYPQPVEPFMANSHRSSHRPFFHVSVPAERRDWNVEERTTPHTRNSHGHKGYFYPVDHSDEFSDFQSQTIHYSHPTATNMLASDFPEQSNSVLSSHQDRLKIQFDPSFTDFKQRQVTVPEPNLYSAFHPATEDPPFISDTVDKFSNRGQTDKDDVMHEREDKTKTSSLIQPKFDGHADSDAAGLYIGDSAYFYYDTNAEDGLPADNEAAFVESGYRRDSIDNLVSAFRQHPGNRYSDQKKQRDQDNNDRNIITVKPDKAPGQSKHDDHKHLSNATQPSDKRLQRMLEETQKQTGGIFIPSPEIKPASQLSVPENFMYTPPSPKSTDLDRSILITDAPLKNSLLPKSGSHGSHKHDAEIPPTFGHPESSEQAEITVTATSTSMAVEESQAAPSVATSPVISPTVSAKEKSNRATISSNALTESTTVSQTSDLKPGRSESPVIPAAATTTATTNTTAKTTAPISQGPTVTLVSPSDDEQMLPAPRTVTFPWSIPAEKNDPHTAKPSISVVVTLVNSSVTDGKNQTQNGNVLPSSAKQRFAEEDRSSPFASSPSLKYDTYSEEPSISSATKQHTNSESRPSTARPTHQYASWDESGISFVTKPRRVSSVLSRTWSTAASSRWRTRTPGTTLDVFRYNTERKDDREDSRRGQETTGSPSNTNAKENGENAGRGQENTAVISSKKSDQTSDKRFPGYIPLKYPEARGRPDNNLLKPFYNPENAKHSRGSSYKSTTTASSPAIPSKSSLTSESVIQNQTTPKYTSTTVSSPFDHAVMPNVSSGTTPGSTLPGQKSTSSTEGPAKFNGNQHVTQAPKVQPRKPSGPTLASLNSKGRLLDKWGHVHTEDVEKSKGHGLSPLRLLTVLTVFTALYRLHAQFC